MQQQQVTPEQAIQIAIQHHQAGRLVDAENIYRQILAIQPERFDALHLLGVIAFQVGKHDAAVEIIRKAITISANVPEAHYNLANALVAQGKHQQAKASFLRALELKPNYAEAHNNMGNSLNEQGKLDEALAAYNRAIGAAANYAEAHFNRANVYKNQGKLAEAIAGYAKTIELRPASAEAYSHMGDALRRAGKLAEAQQACAKAVELMPNAAEARNNFGNVLRDMGKSADALVELSRAVELKPGFAEAHYNLGNVLGDQNKPIDAMAEYAKAIQMNPNFADAHYNLGNCLITQRKLDDAVASYSTAVKINPGHAAAYNNLGSALKNQGLLDEALASYAKAIELKPDNAAFGSNRLFALHFHPAYDAMMLKAEHAKWNEQHAAKLAPAVKRARKRPAGAAKTPAAPIDRKLRIGYVSPDFYFHSVGRFLLPLLENRDREGFEIYCYSDVRTPDVVTERLQGFTDQWRNIVGLSDEQVAEMVRNDKIDVLVDLAAHTADSRLLVFARKPAPVQITYLAYCSTTGLKTIDYRLTDRYFDPPETPDAKAAPASAAATPKAAAKAPAASAKKPVSPYSETTLRLPKTYWCYETITGIAPGPLPAKAAGHVTFGCLNNFAKVSTPALKAWGKILHGSPGSRLLLHAPQGSARQRVLDIMRAAEVDPARITFTDRVSGQEYFQLYRSIDIALDPFPFAGGTTTCDALWMGVPVVTLAGKTAVSRAGASILSNIAMAALIARSEEQYVRKAIELAKDLKRLAAVRSGLRPKMQKSPLMDGKGLTRNIELAYRQMWREAQPSA